MPDDRPYFVFNARILHQDRDELIGLLLRLADHLDRDHVRRITGEARFDWYWKVDREMSTSRGAIPPDDYEDRFRTVPEMLGLLREFEWSASHQGPYGNLEKCCPACGSLHPRATTVSDYERTIRGHRDDCRLAPFLAPAARARSRRGGLREGSSDMTTENEPEPSTVWAALQCPMYHESAYETLSLHRTKAGADAAIERHKAQIKAEWQQHVSEMTEYYSKRGETYEPPGNWDDYRLWEVKAFEVEEP